MSARHRPRRALPAALTGVCALLFTFDGLRASIAPAAPRVDRATTTPAKGRRSAARVGPRAAHPPADSAALRSAADLVRRAREAERAAVAGGRVAGGTLAGGPSAPDSALADSARRGYLAAAALVPEVADYLRLRAAALTPAPAARAALLTSVRAPAAVERVPVADATARARAGDVAGAAAALDTAGRPAQALALRLRGAADGATRATVRAALLALLRTSPENAPAPAAAAGESPRERVRTAALLLDSAFAADPAAALTPAERLDVARALAPARDAATLRRAAAEFASARASGAALAPADAFAEGGALARTGQWRAAAAAYARVAGAPPPLGAAAAYERGRALLRAGDGAGARAALQALADAPPDTAGAAARFLLAELTADDGRENEARAEYQRVAREYPQSRWAPLARYRAGLIAYVAGDPRAAAADFDAVAGPAPAAAPRDSAAADSAANGVYDAAVVAAAYWAGRAWAAAGDAGQARARWELALRRDPASYYAALASRRLGRSWTLRDLAPDARGADPTLDRDAEAAGRRAALLEGVGLVAEAGYERDWLIRWAGDAPARMLAVAHALVAGPRPGPGIRLAARAVERGAPRTVAVWQLLDPLRYGDALRRAARAAGVDPALGAGLVRQESNFTADAVSPVGARGLMQLMPDVGRGLWRGEGGARAWSPDLLFVPDVNLALGMRHLAAGLRGYPDPAYALAAYNAGGARVARWRRLPGAGDPELFVERIPFVETRDYVRVVLRNRELYRALYGL